jgi:site-specific DNA-methyltransferase (cytosine-N4-specific)
MSADLINSDDPKVVYRTDLGTQYQGDSRALLRRLPEGSVDLIVTSPPFALLRPKSYGNKIQSEYVSWLADFGMLAKRVLKDTGSLVLEVGGAYQRGRPVRSLYNYRVLIEFCDTIGFELAEEFFWFNPARIPSPIEWVNKRKIRAKDAVSPLWWFSKTDAPKADTRRVRVEYSKSMRELLKEPDGYYKPGTRPSAHQIGTAFHRDNGGALPSNLLQCANTESTSTYLRACRLLGEKPHPARFPAPIPRFFVRFLTEPGDVVLDIFSGSNTTGWVAEAEGRRWLSCEVDADFARLSSVRFMAGWSSASIVTAWDCMQGGQTLLIDADHTSASLSEAGVGPAGEAGADAARPS